MGDEIYIFKKRQNSIPRGIKRPLRGVKINTTWACRVGRGKGGRAGQLVKTFMMVTFSPYTKNDKIYPLEKPLNTSICPGEDHAKDVAFRHPKPKKQSIYIVEIILNALTP